MISKKLFHREAREKTRIHAARVWKTRSWYRIISASTVRKPKTILQILGFTYV